MWMTRVSINHPVFATMVMVALTVLGLFAYNKLGVEPMPDINPPTVSIRVVYPGASPEQVENDLTKPVENAVNTVAGVKRILSASYEGVSSTWVEFRLDVDTTRVTQEIRDKLAQIRAGFPRDAKDPVVERGGSENDQPVATYTLVGTNKTQRELTLAAEQIVQKGFERVNGVGRVALGGTVTRQIQVRVDPAKLTAFGLTVDTVVQALRNANVAVPVGTISNATAEAIVRVDGRLSEPRQFDNIIVARRNGTPILLSQVAEVRDAERERQSLTRVNGQPAVGVYIFKTQDANIVEVGRALKAAAVDIGKQLPAGAELKLLWAMSDFVQQSVDNVKRTIVEGAAADGADRVPVPRVVAQHGHHGAHAADRRDRDLHRDLRARLHAELHDADGAVAVHRPADRRRHRRAREHRAAHPHGQGPLHRGARGHRRDRPGGPGDDLLDRRRVRADRLHERDHRQVLLPVRHDGGRRRAGVAVRQLHAGPDAVGRVARPARGREERRA